MNDIAAAQRRGFWMRMAREFADLSQATAAKELGLSGRSKSTLSAWENGAREPRISHVAKMAALYGVPVDLLMNPPASAREVIERRLSSAIADAETAERADWDTGPGQGPSGAGEPGGAPRRLSA